MKISIIHDSQKGNGEKLAAQLAKEFTGRGATVKVGHRSQISSDSVAADPPDLLVIGSAVRKFMTSPPVKKWIKNLDSALKEKGTTIPYAAMFLTHVMPDKMVLNRVNRMQKSISGVAGIGALQENWLSGQVKDIPGPFIDGVEEKAAEYAALLIKWAKTG